MKTKLIVSALACVCVLGTAQAAPSVDDYNVIQSVFNPTYRPNAGDWGISAGINFQTGTNSDASDQTDFGSGETQVGDVRVVFGMLDNLYLSLEAYGSNTSPFTTGGFANPEVGLNWQLFRAAKSFGLDLVAKYGFALTKDAVTDERIGMNNAQAGLRIYGDEGSFQWAIQSLAQLVFDPTIASQSEMWDLLSRAELEFEIVDQVGIRGEFNYNVYNLNREENEARYTDMNASLGVVCHVSPGAAVQPYVAYHFETDVSGGDIDGDIPNNYWQIGAKFGVQF